MTTDRATISTSSPRRVLAAWTGVWALLIQIMVPVGQGVPVIGANGLPQTLVICSTLQPRTIPGPGSQAPVQPDPRSCAVCLAFAAGNGTDLPSAIAAPPPPALLTMAFDPRPHTVLPGRMPGLPLSRGPPSVLA